MQTITLPPTAEGTIQAATLLRQGALVAFGTETVYGLGADATNPQAVAAIFTAKGRPHFNPLICHYPTAAEAFAHVTVNGHAEALARAFWPGPLTLILKRRVTCPVALLAGAGLDTLAIRVPGHQMALGLLREAGTPIAAPSANRSGGVSPTTAAHVRADLDGRIAAILDCGPATIGLESTVLDLTGEPTLLRPGAITAEAITALIGPIRQGLTLAQAVSTRSLRSPGLLISHYAPTLPVRLAAIQAHPGEALLAFGPAPPAALTWNLSPAANPTEAAARLFEGLRWLDIHAQQAGLTAIAAMPIPMHGLGAAINDRLQRAAAPRT